MHRLVDQIGDSMMNHRILFHLLLIGLVVSMSACAKTPFPDLRDEANLTLRKYRRNAPSFKKFFDSAHGYVVFPNVQKGGIGLGAAYGEGVVYVEGELDGYAQMKQATIGFQLGGRPIRKSSFSEIRKQSADLREAVFLLRLRHLPLLLLQAKPRQLITKTMS
jgi:hypothetical protein